MHVGAVFLAYGCGGVLGLVAAGALVDRRPGQALGATLVLMLVSLVLVATVTSTASSPWSSCGAWPSGAFPSLSQTVMLRAADGATDAATALVNATTNLGIAGGAFLGSRLLGVVEVPSLGWVRAGLVAASLLVYATRLRRTA